MINTPHRLVERAELYQQLASLTSAGVGLLQGIEHLRRNPPNRNLQRPLEDLARHINQGATFAEALERSGNWMPAFDLSLLDAGERSGRLDSSFRLLAEYYRDRAQLARSVIANLLYPVGLLHFAVLIFPVSALQGLVLQGEIVSFLLHKLMVLLPAYFLVFFGIYLGQGQRGVGIRTLVETLMRGIPILGKARRNLALARLSAALEALINAGVSIIEAWRLAADASGSVALQRTVHHWRAQLEGGVPPSDLVSHSPGFPDLFANQYRTGEVSGKLDETLRRLHTYYQDEATRQLAAFAQWMPRLAYVGIMLYIAWQVIRFWMAYFDQINRLTG